MTIPRLIGLLAMALLTVAIVEEHDDVVRSAVVALIAFVVALALAGATLIPVYAARGLLGHSAQPPWPVIAVALALAGFIVCPVFVGYQPDDDFTTGGGCGGHVPLLAHLTAGEDRVVAAAYWGGCED